MRLENFIWKHGEELLRLAYTYVKDYQMAEDIYREPTIYTVYEHPEQIPLHFQSAPQAQIASLPNKEPTDERVLPNGDRVMMYEHVSGMFTYYYYVGKYGTAFLL